MAQTGKKCGLHVMFQMGLNYYLLQATISLTVCPEMHLTLILGHLYKTDLLSFSYDFIFDRIICVLVRI